jgi:hypothetical protein
MISLGTPPATHFPIARSAVWGLRININKGSEIPQILPLRNGKTLSNYYFLNKCTSFSPQFCGIQLVVTVLSHRCNSHTDSGEAKIESHASSKTQPNQAALLLDTIFKTYFVDNVAATIFYEQKLILGSDYSLRTGRRFVL